MGQYTRTAQFAHFPPLSLTFALSVTRFRNQGQTCYLNATLQLLYHLNRFKSALLRASQAVGDSDTDALEAEDLNCFEKSVSRALADVFRSKQNKDVVDPAALKRCIGLVLRQFANNDQEDAHELLYTLLDRVQMDFAPFEPPRGAVQNPVGANFVWELEQDMHCRECGYSSRKSDVFHDLSLDLPDEREFGGRTISLRTLVGKFFNVILC